MVSSCLLKMRSFHLWCLFSRFCWLSTIIFSFCISNTTMGRFVITLYRIFYIKSNSIVKDTTKEKQLFWILVSLSSFLNIVTSSVFYFDTHHRNFLYYNLCMRSTLSQGEVQGDQVTFIRLPCKHGYLLFSTSF